jgi:DNA-binding IclR family transcriptional regulator
MSGGNPFFTKKLSQTLTIIQRMASPKGVTVNELAECLSLKRLAVFRLIRTMEHELHIPVTRKRETFGGSATYYLPQSFIDSLAHIKTSTVVLTFEEAVLAHMFTTADADDPLRSHLLHLRKALKLPPL